MSDNNEVMALLETYEKYYPNFTYAHPDAPEYLNALQMGFVGIFYLKKGWLKRSVVAECLGIFVREFADHIKFYQSEVDPIDDFDQISLEQRQQMIVDWDIEDYLNITVGNSPSQEYVNEIICFILFFHQNGKMNYGMRLVPLKFIFLLSVYVI